MLTWIKLPAVQVKDGVRSSRPASLGHPLTTWVISFAQPLICTYSGNLASWQPVDSCTTTKKGVSATTELWWTQSFVSLGSTTQSVDRLAERIPEHKADSHSILHGYQENFINRPCKNLNSGSSIQDFSYPSSDHVSEEEGCYYVEKSLVPWEVTWSSYRPHVTKVGSCNLPHASCSLRSSRFLPPAHSQCLAPSSCLVYFQNYPPTCVQ